jgi:RNA polymerase sigma-70 factor (ECF subfamily)
MRYNPSSLNPADFWPIATKAVASYIGKRYAGAFTAEDIEDIVAAVVCKMWAARASFDPEKGKFFSWVWAIAQNAILDAVDAQAKRRGISGDFEKVGGGTYSLPIPNYAADGELICDDKVEYYLHELTSERDKRFLLYLVDGLSYDEIASREAIPVRQVYMVVFRLRQRLKGLAG